MRPISKSAMAGPPMVPGCHVHKTALAFVALLWNVSGRPDIMIRTKGFPTAASSAAKAS